MGACLSRMLPISDDTEEYVPVQDCVKKPKRLNRLLGQCSYLNAKIEAERDSLVDLHVEFIRRRNEHFNRPHNLRILWKLRRAMRAVAQNEEVTEELETQLDYVLYDIEDILSYGR